MSEEEVHANGFQSLAQFNSLRFLDHSLGIYMDLAAQEDYFENTLFFFLGDNGTAGPAPHFPRAEEELDLCWFHTPFLIYGRNLKEAGRTFDVPGTQMDLMPTVAGAIGLDVPETTIGRNLLDPALERYAFVQLQRGLRTYVGLLGEEYFALSSVDGLDRSLHSYRSPTPTEDLSASDPRRLEDMTELGLGLYHASKWMLYHNGREGRK